jgi:hypothetical protein
MLHAVDFCRRFRTSFYAHRMSIDEAIRAISDATPAMVEAPPEVRS